MTDTGGDDTRWLDDQEQHSWRALLMGMTLLLDRLDDELRRRCDLSLVEYEILVRLSEAPDRQMRMAQLAEALAHSRSRVTHTVARMEHAGLVLRRSSPDDGRGVVAAMTSGLVAYASDEVPGLLGKSTTVLRAELGPGYDRELVHRDDLVLVRRRVKATLGR